jgi:hypothetical protein
MHPCCQARPLNRRADDVRRQRGRFHLPCRTTGTLGSRGDRNTRRLPVPPRPRRGLRALPLDRAATSDATAQLDAGHNSRECRTQRGPAEPSPSLVVAVPVARCGSARFGVITPGRVTAHADLRRGEHPQEIDHHTYARCSDLRRSANQALVEQLRRGAPASAPRRSD